VPREFTDTAQLHAAVGENLGSSEWTPVEQDRIDLFADATDDHQWIHLDLERAAAGPCGTTIAHGFLTLSLILALAGQVYEIPNTAHKINYGLNRVRFTSPARSRERVRLTSTLTAVDNVDGGVQLTFAHVIELEGRPEPACAADMLGRIYF
jgi:acyl dehydratase